MAGMRSPENMSVTELVKLRDQIDRLLTDRKSQAKAELRTKMAEMAKAAGMSLDEALDGRKARGSRGKMRGKVAVKYRDPSNAANTWTGRGRTPRWMVAAMKGGKTKKEDFLI